MINVKTYNIEWPKVVIKNNIFRVPIYIVFQSNSKSIENYCFNNYNDVTHEAQYTPEQMKMFSNMVVYIKNHITEFELKNVLDFLFEKKWFSPLIRNDKLFKLTPFEYDCKMWDSDLPYLEIKFELEFNIEKIIEIYFLRSYLKPFIKNKHIVKENLELVFNKQLPAILTYNNNPYVYECVIKYIETQLKKKSKINSMFEKILKIKKLNTYNFNIKWKIMYTTISIEYNDYKKLLFRKISKNKVNIALGAYGLYTIGKNRD